MDKNTRLIVDACKLVVRAANDYDNETFTVPKTVVQSIYELDYLLDKIRKENRRISQREADNAMTEGFEHSVREEK